MKYSGPRMLWNHPILAMGHFIDGFRKKPAKAAKGGSTLLCLILLLFMSGVAHIAWAEPTSGCHCFKNRTFNPNDSFAADDYILATSFNSLISKYFDIAKGQIVMLKMQGSISQDDLLIALLTTKVSTMKLQELLALHKKSSWQKILATPGMSKSSDTNKSLMAIKEGLAISKAGKAIADNMLVDFYNIPEGMVKKFRTTSLNEKEMSLLFILAKSASLPPGKIAALHNKAGKSWSEIAHNLGITPAEAGKLILNSPR